MYAYCILIYNFSVTSNLCPNHTQYETDKHINSLKKLFYSNMLMFRFIFIYYCMKDNKYCRRDIDMCKVYLLLHTFIKT